MEHSQTGHFIDTTKVSDVVIQLREKFAGRIVGQIAATEALTRVLENHLGGFADPRRPIGSMLFIGPTGTGKTSTVEAFCEGLFGSRDAMIKIDCGEFQHSHEVAKLIGSPPGYLGHQETPARLSQKALNAFHRPELPISVVLFDEIEKASDSVWHLLLGILDKGTLTLGSNETTNFTKSIVIMTSNVGAAQMAISTGENDFGFSIGIKTIDNSRMKDIALSAARRRFSPEFLNRLDDIVMFETLTKTELDQIMDLEMSYLQNKLFAIQPSRIIISPIARREVLKRGYDAKYNARNLRRTIEKQIMLPIARAISTGQITSKEDVVVTLKGDDFEFFALGQDGPSA